MEPRQQQTLVLSLQSSLARPRVSIKSLPTATERKWPQCHHSPPRNPPYLHLSHYHSDLQHSANSRLLVSPARPSRCALNRPPKPFSSSCTATALSSPWYPHFPTATLLPRNLASAPTFCTNSLPTCFPARTPPIRSACCQVTTIRAMSRCLVSTWQGRISDTC